MSDRCLIHSDPKVNHFFYPQLSLLFQVNLLDGKRSLNVNIFLSQFRMAHEEIVQLIEDGESAKIGAEKLRGLQKILPETDEVRACMGFAIHNIIAGLILGLRPANERGRYKVTTSLIG